MRRDGRFRGPRPEIAGQWCADATLVALNGTQVRQSGLEPGPGYYGERGTIAEALDADRPHSGGGRLRPESTPIGGRPGQMPLGAPLVRSRARHRRSRAISPITMCISESTNVTEKCARTATTRPLERLPAPGTSSAVKRADDYPLRDRPSGCYALLSRRSWSGVVLHGPNRTQHHQWKVSEDSESTYRSDPPRSRCWPRWPVPAVPDAGVPRHRELRHRRQEHLLP